MNRSDCSLSVSLGFTVVPSTWKLRADPPRSTRVTTTLRYCELRRGVLLFKYNIPGHPGTVRI
jgi:hypothetical protein